MDIAKPIYIWRKLVFQHGVIMMMTAKGATEKDDALIRQRHNGVLQRMPFFFPTIMLTLFGILLRTTIRTFGGVNDHVIDTLQSGFQRLRGAKLSIRHQLSVHQGIV